MNPVDQTQAEYVTTPDDTFERHEPTLELGGPIVRNRAWFFLGVAPDLERTSRTVTFRTNNQKATFDQNEEDYNTIFNVTSQLNAKMRLKGTINRQSFRDEPAFPTIEPDGTSTSNPSLFPGDDHRQHVRQLLRRRARLGDEREAVRQRHGRPLRLRIARERGRRAAAPHLWRFEPAERQLQFP